MLAGHSVKLLIDILVLFLVWFIFSDNIFSPLFVCLFFFFFYNFPSSLFPGQGPGADPASENKRSKQL